MTASRTRDASSACEAASWLRRVAHGAEGTHECCSATRRARRQSRAAALYWQLGRDILERQEQAGWGAGVVDREAADLRAAFPDMRGFSRSNLKYMRAVAEAWPDPIALGPQPRLADQAQERRRPARPCRERPQARLVAERARDAHRAAHARARGRGADQLRNTPTQATVRRCERATA
jgi:hypothetical protein